MSKAILSLALVAGSAYAAGTASQYGQCGGKGWTGATACPSGWHCQYSNDYYSQCLQGAGSTTAGSSPTTAKSSTSTVKTSSSVVSTAPTTKASVTPSTTVKPTSSSAGTPPSSSPVVSASASVSAIAGNPWSGYQQYANSYYASEVYSLAIPSLPASLAPKASAVAKIPSFYWLDTHSKVPQMNALMDDIDAKNAAGASPPIQGLFVVYDLPDRDCAAYSSNGEYSYANNGAANYQSYIDDIAAVISNHSSSVILVVEPDSLGNLVTNMNVAKCSNAAASYKASFKYSLAKLNLPKVAMYLDAGHAGWLGWSANIGPAAQLFAQIWQSAGSPAAVRGLATNVANYNGWKTSPCPSYTQGDSNCNEYDYHHALAPLLTQYGYPAHFIMDTSRNGVQPTAQQAWGDWCNVKGTGFGVPTSSNTGDDLLDAFAWVKPGGECDGTSDSSAPRFDSHCALSDALQPAPQAGTWFQAYFQQLLVNANPPIQA